MAYNETQLAEFIRDLSQLVPRSDIQRTDWKRQTDAVKIACVTSQMWAEDSSRVFLVDGRIENSLIREALNSGGVKKFFNQRCHDKKLKCRRVIMFDTKSGNNMDEGGNQLSNLHFHAIIMLDDVGDAKWLLGRLRAVFGHAATLGSRQFWVNSPDPERYHSFADRQGMGIGGKVCYMLSHAGTTYANLKLNAEGRRSRRAPDTRRSCNTQANGLAAGNPSNFLSDIVICDNVSKREARRAFEGWMKVAPNRGEKNEISAEVGATCHDVSGSEPHWTPYAPSHRPGVGDPSQATIPF